MIDKIDTKLILLLLSDSRRSITQIAKQAGVSRDVAQYRIQQLTKDGVIRSFTTNIDHKKLGYSSALFFVSITAEKEAEFVEYLNRLDFVSWAGTHLGFWSLGMAIYGKSLEDVEARFQIIFQKYKNHITNHRFEFYKTTEFYPEKYFDKQHLHPPAKKQQPYSIDKHDKVILAQLSKNARIKTVELAEIVPLTPVAIAQRITKLENSGYIKGYSAYVNVHKIGLYLFVFFIRNKTLDQRKKLFAYLQNHPKVSLLLDYIGDPFIEFGIFVKNPYETREILQEIKGAFPDNELVDMFLTQEDFISYGAPKCVFE